MPNPSYVVTGGATGGGRAIAERLARNGHVVVLDVAEHLDWAMDRVQLLSGDARDPHDAGRRPYSRVCWEPDGMGEQRGDLSRRELGLRDRARDP